MAGIPGTHVLYESAAMNARAISGAKCSGAKCGTRVFESAQIVISLRKRPNEGINNYSQWQRGADCYLIWRRCDVRAIESSSAPSTHTPDIRMNISCNHMIEYSRIRLIWPATCEHVRRRRVLTTRSGSYAPSSRPRHERLLSWPRRT